MQEGKIKLGKHNRFLSGSIEEQVNKFREALPDNEDDIYDGLWFLFENSPGGIVWIHEDGYEEWT